MDRALEHRYGQTSCAFDRGIVELRVASNWSVHVVSQNGRDPDVALRGSPVLTAPCGGDHGPTLESGLAIPLNEGRAEGEDPEDGDRCDVAAGSADQDEPGTDSNQQHADERVDGNRGGAARAGGRAPGDTDADAARRSEMDDSHAVIVGRAICGGPVTGPAAIAIGSHPPPRRCAPSPADHLARTGPPAADFGPSPTELTALTA
jgi:hypothetical protein